MEYKINLKPIVIEANSQEEAALLFESMRISPAIDSITYGKEVIKE